MVWLTNLSVERLQKLSNEGTFIIFKHSPRCSISLMTKSRWERGWKDSHIPVFLIDVIAQRSLSNTIAHHYGIEHQSPQVLVINNGNCVYSDSHNSIDPGEISRVIEKVVQ